jgi:hypothetical protein
MFIIGGMSDYEVTDTTLKYESIQDYWREVAPIPALREAFASCVNKSSIYVDEGGEDQASVFKFDTEANEWSTNAPMPIVCSSHSASLIGSEVSLVGAASSGREVLRSDFTTSTWSTLAYTLYDRVFGISFVLAGCLYAAGGGHDTSASVERYDVATNTWTAVADMLEGRRSLGAFCIESEGPNEEQDLFDSLIAKAFI